MAWDHNWQGKQVIGLGGQQQKKKNAQFGNHVFLGEFLYRNAALLGYLVRLVEGGDVIVVIVIIVFALPNQDIGSDGKRTEP